MNKPGKIIILNGASSAGKTSLAKAMQRQFNETYRLMGNDMFWMTMPEKQIDLTTVDAEFYTWTIRLGERLAKVGTRTPDLRHNFRFDHSCQ